MLNNGKEHVRLFVIKQNLPLYSNDMNLTSTLLFVFQLKVVAFSIRKHYDINILTCNNSVLNNGLVRQIIIEISILNESLRLIKNIYHVIQGNWKLLT